MLDKKISILIAPGTILLLIFFTSITFGNSMAGVPQLPSGNQYFYSLLVSLMDQHPRIKTAREDVEEAREQIRINFGRWYPELEFKIEAGREDEHNKEFPEHYNKINLKLKQKLLDFGKTDAAVEKAGKTLISKELNFAKIRLQFIFDAATAYQNLHRTYTVLQFSLESEANIRRQTGLEEIRVAEGAGYTTDVLQSKSQLASAVSRRLHNEGTWNMAKSEYLELFTDLPDNIKDLHPLDPSQWVEVPLSSNMAVKKALSNNLELLLVRNREIIAVIDRQKEKSSAFYPDVDFTLEGSVSDNYDGIFGYTSDYKAMVELKKTFNLGFTEKNKIRAASHNVKSAKYQVTDMEKNIRKKTCMNWQRLETARAVTLSLTRQAELTKGFLDLARKERQLGNRSLMDILAGETSLINAKSDSYSAKIDISIAIFSLLQTTGQLGIEMFDRQGHLLEQ